MRPLLSLSFNKVVKFFSFYNKSENQYEIQIPFVSIRCDEPGLWKLRVTLLVNSFKHKFKYTYKRVFGYYWKPFIYGFKSVYCTSTDKRLGLMRDKIQIGQGVNYVYKSKNGFVGIGSHLAYIK